MQVASDRSVLDSGWSSLPIVEGFRTRQTESRKEGRSASRPPFIPLRYETVEASDGAVAREFNDRRISQKGSFAAVDRTEYS